MKKSLILAGMLCIGYANAQTTETYEGKVGINTDTPSAILNVKSKNDTNSPKNLELENQSGKKLATFLNDGKIGFGTDTPEYRFDIIGETTNYEGGAMAFRNFRENSGSGALDFFKARGTYANPTSVKLQDKLGGMNFMAYNGTKYIPTASIFTQVIGTNSANSIKDNFVRTSINLGIYSISKSSSSINYKSVISVYQDENEEEVHRAYIDGITTVSSLKGNAGEGNRPVYAKEDGTLVIGSNSTEVKATETTKICDENNAGTFYYKEKTVDGKKRGVMGFCTKQDDVYTWVYFSNGAGVLQSAGSNQFDTL